MADPQDIANILSRWDEKPLRDPVLDLPSRDPWWVPPKAPAEAYNPEPSRPSSATQKAEQGAAQALYGIARTPYDAGHAAAELGFNIANRKPGDAALSAAELLAIFAGPRAKTADLKALNRAKEMAAQGVHRDQIWKELGWGQLGPAGDWKFEVPDNRMAHAVPTKDWLKKDDAGRYMAPHLDVAWDKAAQGLSLDAPMRAKRLFNHPELERAYPHGFTRSDQHGDIMGLPIGLLPRELSVMGGYAPEGVAFTQRGTPIPNQPAIALNEALGPRDARGTMVHELQHASSNHEGFPDGANFATVTPVYDRANEEISNLLSAQDRLRQDRSLLPPNSPQHAIYEETQGKVQELLDKAARQLAYHRDAGEVEARNATTRMDMTPEQRRNTPPWLTEDVPTTQQILQQYSDSKPSGQMSMSVKPDEYRGEHGAPGPDSGSPIHDVSANGIYPKDFYGPQGLHYYGTGNEEMDASAYRKIMSFKDKPDAMVPIYRAIPEVKGKPKGLTLGSGHINPGDWVTISREYAKDHGESALNGKYHISKRMVPARELYTSGDSMLEWGWSPSEASSPAAVLDKNYGSKP